MIVEQKVDFTGHMMLCYLKFSMFISLYCIAKYVQCQHYVHHDNTVDKYVFIYFIYLKKSSFLQSEQVWENMARMCVKVGQFLICFHPLFILNSFP